MSNYAQSEFIPYRSKTTEELAKLLEAESATVVYRSLVVLEGRKEITANSYILLKEISENGKTFKNRKMACVLLRKFFPEMVKGIQPGESKVVGFVYFIRNKISGHVKIGRAKKLERRMDIFSKSYSFPIELIQHIYTLNYEKIELAFHSHFNSKRRNGEWFALDDIDIENIRQRKFPEEIEVLIIKNNAEDQDDSGQ